LLWILPQFTGKKRNNTGGIVRLFAEEVRQYTQQRRVPRINLRFLDLGGGIFPGPEAGAARRRKGRHRTEGRITLLLL
jgi:hypothetical protein